MFFIEKKKGSVFLEIENIFTSTFSSNLPSFTKSKYKKRKWELKGNNLGEEVGCLSLFWSFQRQI